MIATVLDQKIGSGKSIEQLSRIVFSFTAKERMMAMLAAYFDESGTHSKSPIIAIAGYISNDEQWAKFNEEWQTLLDRYSLEYFHMNQFENRQGQFRGMSEHERHALLDSLITFIGIRARSGIAAAFDLSAYNELVAEGYEEIIGPPYALCASLCIVGTQRWAVKHSYQEPIAFLFERGARHSGLFHKAYNKALKNSKISANYRLGTLAFPDKREALPLQAADILAYEVWKYACVELSGEPRPRRWPRYSFNRLRAFPIESIYADKESLRKYALEMQARGETYLDS